MVKVTLNDADLTYEQAEDLYQAADQWAQQNCRTYLGYEVNDVSDFSYTHDILATYEFSKEQDATWFKLKWM